MNFENESVGSTQKLPQCRQLADKKKNPAIFQTICRIFRSPSQPSITQLFIIHNYSWNPCECLEWETGLITQVDPVMNQFYIISAHFSEGKAIPLLAWTGPEGSRKLRLPDFKTIST